MSQWTHVNGHVRFDFLPVASDEGFKDEIKAVLGEVLTYDHVGLFGQNHSERPQSHIPCGSEGSIEYELFKSPRGYNLSIWGDLRNYGIENVQEIVDWFGKLMTCEFKAPFLVRCAVLYIDVEYGEDIILLSDHNDEKRFKKFVLNRSNKDKQTDTERELNELKALLRKYFKLGDTSPKKGIYQVFLKAETALREAVEEEEDG